MGCETLSIEDAVLAEAWEAAGVAYRAMRENRSAATCSAWSQAVKSLNAAQESMGCTLALARFLTDYSKIIAGREPELAAAIRAEGMQAAYLRFLP